MKLREKINNLFNLPFLGIGLIHCIVITILNGILFTESAFYSSPFVITTKITVYIAIIAFWQYVPKIITRIKEKDEKTKIFLIHFFVYLAINLIFLALTYPGMWTREDAWVMQRAASGDIFFFYNWFSSFYTLFSSLITSSPIGVILVQISLISGIFGYIMSEMYFLCRSKIIYITAIPFIFLSTIRLNLYPFRHTMNAFLILFLLCLIIFKYLKKEEFKYFDAISWGILCSIIVFWRTENFFFILMIPLLILFVFGNVPIKRYLTFIFILLFCSSAGLTFQWYGLDKIEKRVEEYKMNAITYGMNELIDNNFKSTTKEKDLKLINDICKPDAGGYYHVRDYSNPEKLSELKKTYVRMVITNFREFFVIKLTKIAQSNEFLLDRSRNDLIKVIREEDGNKLMPKVLFPDLRAKVCIILDCAEFTGGKITKKTFYNFFYNLTIPLIMLIITFLIGLIKKEKTIMFVTSVILIQTFITMMVTADSLMFYYYLTMYFAGWILPLIFLALHLSKRIKQNT